MEVAESENIVKRSMRHLSCVSMEANLDTVNMRGKK